MKSNAATWSLLTGLKRCIMTTAMTGKIVNVARREGLTLVFVMLLAVRLLTPGGFMPEFDHGRVTIVVCDEATPSGHHGHGHDAGKTKPSHPCPYGAASALTPFNQPGAALFAPFAGASIADDFVVPLSLSGARHPPRPRSRAPPEPI
jgi:hypothetical protein